MIQQPWILLILFIALVWLILLLSKQSKINTVFRYLPVPFWCYFIPTLIASVDLIPYDHPFYGSLSRFILPIALFLLLIGTDLYSILKLSPKALAAIGLGSLGIYIGGIITFVLAEKTGIFYLEPWNSEIWKGWGCLSATWTGGSANMIAVKEILQTPETLFSNLIITDTIVAYGWMAFLVFLSQHQELFDSRIGAQKIEAQTESRASEQENALSQTPPLKKIMMFFILFITGYGVAKICELVAGLLPLWGTIFNRFTWIIILATTIPLIFSLTPIRRMEEQGASKVGGFLLYILLASIGARASLHSLTQAPWFILFGFFWVLVHGLTLLAFAKVFRFPLSLLATASQANIGGPISAPLVAGIYQKNLAPLGVILGVLGNIYGTYAGLFFSTICSSILNMIK